MYDSAGPPAGGSVQQFSSFRARDSDPNWTAPASKQGGECGPGGCPLSPTRVIGAVTGLVFGAAATASDAASRIQAPSIGIPDVGVSAAVSSGAAYLGLGEIGNPFSRAWRRVFRTRQDADNQMAAAREENQRKMQKLMEISMAREFEPAEGGAAGAAGTTPDLWQAAAAAAEEAPTTLLGQAQKAAGEAWEVARFRAREQYYLIKAMAEEGETVENNRAADEILQRCEQQLVYHVQREQEIADKIRRSKAEREAREAGGGGEGTAEAAAAGKDGGAGEVQKKKEVEVLEAYDQDIMKCAKDATAGLGVVTKRRWEVIRMVEIKKQEQVLRRKAFAAAAQEAEEAEQAGSSLRGGRDSDDRRYGATEFKGDTSTRITADGGDEQRERTELEQEVLMRPSDVPLGRRESRTTRVKATPSMKERGETVAAADSYSTVDVDYLEEEDDGAPRLGLDPRRGVGPLDEEYE